MVELEMDKKEEEIKKNKLSSIAHAPPLQRSPLSEAPNN
jgi:hypothetical protein